MKSTASNNLKHNRRKGITLIEVVVSSLLISLLAITALKTSGGIMRTWNQVGQTHDESILAEQLLGEILQASYEDPETSPDFGIESNENQSPTNRSEFDDTDDYDDWTESPPKTKDGTPLVGFTGWTRSVDIKKLNNSNPTTTILDVSTDQGMRRVTVTVTDPNGNSTSLSAWRSDVGSPDQQKGADGIFVVWVGCELKVGATGETVSAGTNVLNHATDDSP